jgi:hypothetical protein
MVTATAAESEAAAEKTMTAALSRARWRTRRGCAGATVGLHRMVFDPREVVVVTG